MSSIFARSAVFPISLALLSACASAGSQKYSETSPAYSRDIVVTPSAIASSSAQTAWDVVLIRAPQLLSQGGRGSRGFTTSLAVGGQPLLVLDGSRTNDLSQLAQIPAAWIQSVRILNDTDGSAFYGPSGAYGVILVSTKQ